MINGNDIAALRGQISSDASTGSIGGDTDVAPSLRQLVNSRVILAESRLQLRLQAMNATIQMLKKQNPLGPRKRLRNLTRRLTRLEQLLLKDECASNPCQHGGTCEDGFNRYICRCLDGFQVGLPFLPDCPFNSTCSFLQGTNCEQDVDECSHYQGTELGCQNGGTCLNTMGSFHCLCPANFHGVRCTIEFNDCRNTSNHEICGYGVCFDMPRTNNGVSRYRCVCYQGYTKSMANVESAPCDTDVDECATGENRCSKNPPVACFNTRSGYTCGPCPTGYSGDGYTCTASDLCLLNNGGCSISPRVQCTSTLGRVFCASCPPGFVGDGKQTLLIAFFAEVILSLQELFAIKLMVTFARPTTVAARRKLDVKPTLLFRQPIATASALLVSPETALAHSGVLPYPALTLAGRLAPITPVRIRVHV